MSNTEEQKEIAHLRSLLKDKEDEIARLKLLIGTAGLPEIDKEDPSGRTPTAARHGHLTKDEVSRYSRQLILPQVGVEGQKQLANSSVLILGAGGLGCPAAIYLAAAGVGHVGVVDYDVVEVSNLHRQIMHREASVGVSKAASLAQAVRSLNSRVRVTVHDVQLDGSNAMDMVSGYDVALDCSDNPATRYLINDACVLAGRPLISGSALRWEGQLTVYNYRDGPCYRCLYPTPPNPQFVTNCSDGGVIGAVPGLIGTLQAMETIKLLLAEVKPDTSNHCRIGPSFSGRLLVFDGESAMFRTVSLRPKQLDCAVCASPQTRTINRVQDVDYALFCGRGPHDKDEGLRILKGEDRVTASEFRNVVQQSLEMERRPYLLIDVRPHLETSICSLPDSVNVPFENLEERVDELKELVNRHLARKDAGQSPLSVYVVCRRGNNSQLAVERMRTLLPADWPVVIKDIVGGLQAWAEQVDPLFPIY
ncbi:hypothetical protein GHT06_011704 [Daphnia sinensis]|uniref:Adenylyltransferase and sulfurtransferase MOCS3 homolog n=1 Tax=Daphnia sinensis TaxID=1820382 RepID=A0AAD5KX15_9CRUS|nr:hypothetical protein GHT06_011704 [Daphnia sinensis]